MSMHSLPIYSIQEWLFDEAEGKYTIDLAESGVQHQFLSDVSYDKNQHMNYSLDIGSYELRKTLASQYGCSVNNICITHGGQEALYLFYRSFLKPLDNVITFTPGWQQSWEIPQQIGCDVTVIKLLSNNNFMVDMELLKSKIKQNTKLIILNYPNNPTGVNINEDLLQELIHYCDQKGIFLLNDEEYLYDYSESIVNKSKFSGCISSLSKIYGFPSTRIGWFIGPQDIVKNMVNYRRYTSVCNSSLCENFAIDILSNKSKHISRYTTLVNHGRKILADWCENIDEITLVNPSNTPFAYLLLTDSCNSNLFCKGVLENYGVLLMPSSVFFHDENAFRITFAREENILKEGLCKIEKYISQLRKKR